MTTDAAVLDAPADATTETPAVADTPSKDVKEQDGAVEGQQTETETDAQGEEASDDNPYRAAVTEAEKAAPSPDYLKGVEETRRALGKERQGDTRKDVNAAFASFESDLEAALGGHAWTDADGKAYRMTPAESTALASVLKKPSAALKNGLLLLALGEVRDFQDAAILKTLPNEEARKAYKDEVASATAGVDPLDVDAVRLATAMEIAAQHTKAYKELERDVKVRLADAYDQGHKAGYVKGRNMPEGTGPVGGSGSGVGSGDISYEQYMKLPEAKKRAFNQAYPEQFRAFLGIGQKGK